MKKYVFFALITLLLASCDPEYNVDFIIENNSSFDLTIVSKKKFEEKIDTNRITGGVGLVLANEWGRGMTTSDYVEEIRELPFENLEISTRDGKQCKIDVLNIEEWSKPFLKKNDYQGFIKLFISEMDF